VVSGPFTFSVYGKKRAWGFLIGFFAGPFLMGICCFAFPQPKHKTNKKAKPRAAGVYGLCAAF
jgi:hypothetical protein